ncbi:MAG: glycosyltransferase family 4 protein [Oscillospiraceae bacterium]|nr:glycosyltransferase family 4 protein [Oscillospiraceae bacterium]
MQKAQKRIAMIGHKYIPSRDGGVEVVVSNLAPHLAEIGYDVTCYNRTNKQLKKQRKDGKLTREYRGVHLIWTPTVDRRGLAAMSSSVIATVMSSFRRFDLVHFHTEGPCVLCWLPRLLGKKVVVTVHGLDHMRQKWGKLASAYIMWGEKAAVRHAHSIIVLSEGVRTYFRERYGRETVLIPNGIDPAEIRPACEITKQFGLAPREYILFLGRLVPEKGIHYLIKAYQMLRTDKKLVIVGGASDTNDYVQHLYDMAGDADSIIFTGFQQGLVAEELYSNAYMYVLPSDLEGMPLSLLEAMNYGCCCVTSDIGECADVLDGCGVTFPRGNVEALRETLQDLCDHPEKAEAHRGEARGKISSKYTWLDITAQTDELYRSLLDG